LKVRVLKSDEYAEAIVVEVIGGKDNFRVTFRELNDGTIILGMAPSASKEQEMGRVG
jgi:hypothetical protein